MKLIVLLLMFFSTAKGLGKSCTYKYTVYNVHKKSSSKPEFVTTKTKKLKDNLIDDSGCTICSEQQALVTLQNGVSFRVCEIFAERIEKSLNKVISEGFPVKKVIGYRPQVSRGEVDVDGNRTVFSNHSFGTAIDINPNHNGLYDNCISWSHKCRLRIGGEWRPDNDKKSISRDSLIIKEMEKIGFKWGGELQGRQKDFMHFSLSGD